ncbi:hypothetical protein M3P05_05265 [Sansalvadorimonas sp. 2012CJ34-2]|uniref:Uncharacterized protein n=1 Tax=Parendozoicomonas callyspongiae TaxID=2942213 RepID=A0ABT0PDB4_9GAMM|nr:hypothetical protein [Sansalvadorimonas sp. 2012CJ34-2]MCL6269354.1 hypothetical protein [Sansalvadorimonas sp. 2012CJ34-2]
MNTSRVLCSLVLASSILLLQGCYEDKQMILDLSGEEGFFDSGFPSDIRRNPDNSIDFNSYPQPLNITIRNYVKWAERDHFGFAPNLPLYMRFDGSVENADFTLPQDPLSYADENAAIQLLDIDPDSNERGMRFPIKVSFREKGDEYRPDELLQVLPAGKPLKENNKYALVVTRKVSPEHAKKLIPNPVLKALLENKNPQSVDKDISSEDAQRALAIYAPLREQLQIDQIAANDIIGATVWTTGSPTSSLDNLGRWAVEQGAPQPLTEFKQVEVNPEYCVVESKWRVPGLQSGLLPYPLLGGKIKYDDNNNPVVQYDRDTPLVITIPRTEMPSDGYPMMFYNHGTGGYATQSYMRGATLADGTKSRQGSPAQVAAQRNWATAAMGGHFGADHEDSIGVINVIADLIPGLSLNIGTYNFMNLPAMRGNFEQSVVERVLFRKLVNELELDPALCPGAASDDGRLRFDPDTQVVMGQSLGSMTAISQAAIDPVPFQGIIGGGAGSYNLGLVMHLSTGEKPLGNTLEPLFFFTGKNDIVDDPFHPLWLLSQQVLAPVDFSIHASRWTRDLAAAESAPNVLIAEGYFDDWVGLYNQKPLLVSLGVDLFGPELDVSEDKQLLPDLENAGYQQWVSSVGGNRDGRTSAVVRYPEDGIKSGHHVIFQQEDARHQYGCFLESIAKGDVPVIPLPAGAQQDTCP